MILPLGVSASNLRRYSANDLLLAQSFLPLEINPSYNCRVLLIRTRLD
ncbi:MAG: hypothetical protein Q8P67_09860 [archaeon]|nr:hypothetical protein [archaeon]